MSTCTSHQFVSRKGEPFYLASTFQGLLERDSVVLYSLRKSSSACIEPTFSSRSLWSEPSWRHQHDIVSRSHQSTQETVFPCKMLLHNACLRVYNATPATFPCIPSWPPAAHLSDGDVRNAARLETVCSVDTDPGPLRAARSPTVYVHPTHPHNTSTQQWICVPSPPHANTHTQPYTTQRA